MHMQSIKSANKPGKTIHKSVSIPLFLQEFLDEHTDLSCSKMLQSKILEVRENRRLIFSELNRQKKTIIFLNKKLAEAGDKIAILEKKDK